MKIINVAIIGYGLSGRIFHSAIINSIGKYKICRIVSTDSSRREEALNDNPQALLTDDAMDVFEDNSIDLVVISTPNTSHLDLAKEAMLSGKHVVVEKPFTVSSKEAIELIEISKQTKRILSVYQNRRFDGDFKTIKNIIKSSALGRLVEFESHFDRFSNNYNVNSWREKPLAGSGLLYDLGSHLIDQALYLFGLPIEIYADIRSQRKGMVDDNFELILYYNDLKVTLKSACLVKEALPRFILQGTEGSYVKFGLDVQEEDLLSGKRPLDNSWGREEEALWGTLNTTKEYKKIQTMQGDYRQYYIDIYDSIIEGKNLSVRPEEGLDVIRVIEAAIRSNDEKRRIVIDK